MPTRRGPGRHTFPHPAIVVPDTLSGGCGAVTTHPWPAPLNVGTPFAIAPKHLAVASQLRAWKTAVASVPSVPICSSAVLEPACLRPPRPQTHRDVPSHIGAEDEDVRPSLVRSHRGNTDGARSAKTCEACCRLGLMGGFLASTMLRTTICNGSPSWKGTIHAANPPDRRRHTRHPHGSLSWRVAPASSPRCHTAR